MFTNEAEKPDADVSPENEDKPVEADAKADESKDQENEAESSTADKEKVEEQPDPAPKLQGRIDKLTKRFRVSERETASLTAENIELRKELELRPEVQEPLKTLEDFEFDNAKYLEYRLSQSDKRAEKVAERVARGFQDKNQSEVSDEEYASREKTFAATVDDFHDAVYDQSLKISASMAEEIRLSDLGPEMAYHLAKNPEIASEISSLSGRETVRRLTLLEADLKAEKAKTSKKVSSAPPPVPGIKAGEAGLEKGYR